MCCAEFLVKYILFFVNLIFVLAGIGLIAVGITILVQLSDVADLFPSGVVNSVPIFVIVLGCVVFFIAFFGCCGAIRESRCLLVTYSVCMLILAAAKIWVTVIIFRSLDNLQDTLDGWLQRLFDGNPPPGPFQAIETVFRCCGTGGANAYTALNLPIPPTCCANPIDNTCTGDTFSGCSIRLEDYFNAFGGAIGYVFIVLIIIELVAMIFGLFLNHAITNNKKRRAVY